jgi:gliding motility-associated-like protein
MRKYLLLLAVLMLSQLTKLSAQKLTPSPDSLFSSPDTVCVNQPVTLRSNVINQTSYYWGFCSGYLMNPPTGLNIGKTYGLKIPGNIDIVNDSGLFYGFVVNTGSREFLRLNFGNSLNNIPTVTNFGTLNGGLPVNPTSLFILKDTLNNHWFIFVTGGNTTANSTLARIDFGPHLSNIPNIANFGNYNNVLSGPKGIFVAQDANHNWWGYLVNYNNSHLVRLDFSFNVSNTPYVYDLGNYNDPITTAPVLSLPSDLAAIRDHGKWYLFVTNKGNNTLARFDLGTILDTSSVSIIGNNLGTFSNRIDSPSSITLNRDCGSLYAYITDSTASQLVAVSMSSATGPYSAINYGVLGRMNYPSGISSILRDKDNLYAFITNARDSSLTRVDLAPCNVSTIPSFSEVNPPAYEYLVPGIYNIYYVINQGTHTMQVDCKPITVLPIPPVSMNTDTTVCEGDTIRLYVISTLADSIRWTATYNIDTNYLRRDSAKVYPDYSSVYPVKLYYPFGCIVDTAVRVHVSKVKADAGPDRWIKDGAMSTIGGPNTTLAPGDPYSTSGYLYHWFPFQFLSDSTVPNPVASPPYDYTYYLRVTELNDTFKCSSLDTVVVHVDCGDFHLPNAFAPNSSNSTIAYFGILNKEISRLNYFSIYNRWGQLLFTTTDVTQKWDGTFNDKPCLPDVYVWIADGFCQNGKRITKSGNVTLMR